MCDSDSTKLKKEVNKIAVMPERGRWKLPTNFLKTFIIKNQYPLVQKLDVTSSTLCSGMHWLSEEKRRRTNGKKEGKIFRNILEPKIDEHGYYNNS